MYKEEKIIDGVLCYRNNPTAEFVPYSKKALTTFIIKLKEKIIKFEEVMNEINVDFEEEI